MKKNILLIATGSIAIIKFKKIYELFKKTFNVKLIATDCAKKYLSKIKEIKLENFNNEFSELPMHIKYAKWADLIVVAPATANIIAKFNAGIADTNVLSALMAARQKILFVPAMNTYMYKSLLARDIISNLSNIGHMFLGPIFGKLYKNEETGMGRMVEPSQIYTTVKNYFLTPKKNILITANATKVKIDNIRYISSYATGTFAKLIANELRMLGAQVKIIDVSEYKNIEVYEIIKNEKKLDLVISTAAFSDFDIKQTSETKIKKGSISKIELINDIDVISKLRDLNINVFGFKLDDLRKNAIKKMNELNLEGILWNKIPAYGNNKISGSIILKNKEITFENEYKYIVAKKIAKEIC